MKRIIIVIFLFCLASGVYAPATAQTYQAEPVTVSGEKVRSNGKVYYSHIVLERQTLFSIAKAYGVSIDEIKAANPQYKLAEDGLKKGEILLVPVKDSSVTKNDTKKSLNNNDYFLHIVKWYENLDDIAKKYGISQELLMKFNGMKDSTVKKKQRIKIPTHPELVRAEESDKNETGSEVEDRIKQRIEDIKEGKETTSSIEFKSRNSVKASLLLPFNSKGDANDNNLDFYSGALIALKELQDKGIGTEFYVYDVASSIPVTQERFQESDVVIGPLSTSDINKALNICPSDTYIVSPLDPRAGSLTGEHGNVIQAPSSNDSQYADLASWVKEDKRGGDKILLITEKNAKSNATANAIVSFLHSKGVEYAPLSYTILESRYMAERLRTTMTKSGSNRVIIASDSEAFVNDAVRNLNLAEHSGFEVILYSPSKIRSFSTIEVGSLHSLDLHVSTSYYIDYNAPEVEKFVLTYRSLFNTDPSQFAFQGYDVTYYFISKCAEYGKNWSHRIEGLTRLLQSDFQFSRVGGEGGFQNTAVKRIIYNPDYSISVVI
ncbi:MAG: LysM peptidoglycan-binding domain-containing protein [Bacteroidales bacterium]